MKSLGSNFFCYDLGGPTRAPGRLSGSELPNGAVVVELRVQSGCARGVELKGVRPKDDEGQTHR
jgi:hypothetical protein